MNVADLMMTRYEEGARGPEAFDCFGLFQELCRRRGVKVPDHPSPAEYSERGAAIAVAVESEGWIPLEAPSPGCAVAIRIGPWVSHLGMVLDDGLSFIHTSKMTGVTVARLDDLRWARRIAGYYAPKEIPLGDRHG